MKIMSIISPFFICFLLHYICDDDDDDDVCMCQIDIYFTIKKVQLVIKHWTFNTWDKVMSIEHRQTFCKGRKCGVLPDSFLKDYWRKQMMSGRRRESFSLSSSSSDWSSVWTIHSYTNECDGSANVIFRLFFVTSRKKRRFDLCINWRISLWLHSLLKIEITLRLNKDINPSALFESLLLFNISLNSDRRENMLVFHRTCLMQEDVLMFRMTHNCMFLHDSSYWL